MTKNFLQAFKPTPLSIIFILLGLMLQVVFCSSSTMTIFPGSAEPNQSALTFGLGSPIRIITVGAKTSYDIRWVILTFNLATTYVSAVFAAAALAKSTRLRRPALAYGLVAVVMVVVAFLVSIGISKAYWGYFISPPGLLSKVSKIAKVQSIIPFKTESNDSGEHKLIPDNTYSLSDSVAFAKKYGDDCRSERILIELERRSLLPSAFAATLDRLPKLYALIQSSGVLVNSDEGYDSSAQLRGIAVDAIDKSGGRLVFLALTGGQLSNDHYPYYELLFAETKDDSGLSFVRAQHFFYDAAGMEGYEWNVIWYFLSIPGICIGFVIFSLVPKLRRCACTMVGETRFRWRA